MINEGSFEAIGKRARGGKGFITSRDETREGQSLDRPDVADNYRPSVNPTWSEGFCGFRATAVLASVALFQCVSLAIT